MKSVPSSLLRLWLTLIAAVSTMGMLSCAAQPKTHEPPQHERVLKVISYNIQFLPGLGELANKRKRPHYRAKMLGQKLGAYDIVGLNEAFETGRRATILTGLKAAWGDRYHVLLSPEPGDRFNGGLVIASRFPFLETNTWTYTQASSPQQHGLKADGLAAKGILHARIAHHAAAQRESVDVFVTHMEARDGDIRETQYVELADFVRKHSHPQRSCLILGDFNTNANPQQRLAPTSQYAKLMAALAQARPGSEVIDLWLKLKPTQLGGTTQQESSQMGKRIDYVLLSNPTQNLPRLEPIDIRINGFLDTNVVALSDHSAVEADFLWRTAP